MHFNQPGTSVTFSDTPLRSFLNEFRILTPELFQGENNKQQIPYSSHGLVVMIIHKAPYVIFKDKKLDKMICIRFHKL